MSNTEYPRLTRVVRLAGTWDRAEIRVLKIVIASALLLTAGRVMAPFEIGKDQALQLQAAHRLLDGRGLTTPYFAAPRSDDVAVRPEPAVLTWWPPGFSLLVAGLLALGLPVAVALRLLYVAATLVGWLGWGALLARFMSRPLEVGSRVLHPHLAVAALLPILWTPPWTGTDILLWAGIPHVFLLLLSPAHRRTRIRPILAAGLLIGLLVTVRYASAFLVIAAILILVQVNIHRLRTSLAQLFVVAVALLALLVPLALYISQFSPAGAPVPEYINAAPGLADAQTSALRLYQKLSVISVLAIGSDLGVKFCGVVGRPWFGAGVGLASALIVFSAPFVLARYRAERPVVFRDDAALSLSLLPISLVVFLLCIRAVSEGDFFGNTRYYEPLALCLVLVSYELLTVRPSHRAVRFVAGALFACFMLHVFLYLPAGALLPARRGDLVRNVLGYTPPQSERYTSTAVDLSYPSAEVYSLKEASRRAVSDLAGANPDAIFFLENYPFYVYDGGDFRSHAGGPPVDVRRLPPTRRWNNAFTSRAIKVFWVLDPSNATDSIGAVEKRLVYTDPYEKTIIYEATYPAGFRWSER